MPSPGVTFKWHLEPQRLPRMTEPEFICLTLGHKRAYKAFPDAQDASVIHDYGWVCERCDKPL